MRSSLLVPSALPRILAGQHKGAGRVGRRIDELLCRNLCRNPPIPTRIGGYRVVSFSINSQTTDHGQRCMNTGESCLSNSFVVAWCFLQRRTVTAEAAGSNPPSFTFIYYSAASESNKPVACHNGTMILVQVAFVKTVSEPLELEALEICF